MKSTRAFGRSAALALSVAFLGAGSAVAAGGVRSATHAERARLIAALVAQDGSSAGVHGVYVSRRGSALGVVCVRTPDSGTRSFVFRRSGRSWRYVTTGPRRGSAQDRGLEGACH